MSNIIKQKETLCGSHRDKKIFINIHMGKLSFFECLLYIISYAV
jgi:hypothetical protein